MERGYVCTSLNLSVHHKILKVKFTCLCSCVDSLCCTGDSFVVRQRCAEHGLVLQFLGDCLNAGLKNKRIMATPSIKIIQTSKGVRMICIYFFWILTQIGEVIYWLIQICAQRTGIFFYTVKSTEAVVFWSKTYMSNNFCLDVRNRDYGEKIESEKQTCPQQLKHLTFS